MSSPSCRRWPGGGLRAARSKALKCGAKDFILADLKREFIEELIFPAVQANAIYEDVYLLGTSHARPVIARGMIEAAEKTAASTSRTLHGQGQRPGSL